MVVNREFVDNHDPTLRDYKSCHFLILFLDLEVRRTIIHLIEIHLNELSSRSLKDYRVFFTE